MKQFVIYSFFILLLVAESGIGQPSHNKDEYFNFTKKFYYHLLEDDTVTVREFVELFSIYAIEDEDYLFLKKCRQTKAEEECRKLAYNRFYINDIRDTAQSIFFQELRKVEFRFTQGYDEQMDSIIQNCGKIYDEGDVSSIALDLYFPNGKTIYFIMNRYPDEPISIGNIYFEDGVYIYTFYDKYISDPEERGDTSTKYLRRFAIIGDPDGYTNVREGKGAGYPTVGKIVTDEVFMFTPNYYEDWWKVQNKDETVVGYMHKSRIVPFGTLPKEKKKELQSKYE